jgi:hypothetical protein
MFYGQSEFDASATGLRRFPKVIVYEYDLRQDWPIVRGHDLLVKVGKFIALGGVPGRTLADIWLGVPRIQRVRVDGIAFFFHRKNRLQRALLAFLFLGILSIIRRC